MAGASGTSGTRGLSQQSFFLRASPLERTEACAVAQAARVVTMPAGRVSRCCQRALVTLHIQLHTLVIAQADGRAAHVEAHKKAPHATAQEDLHGESN